MVKGAAAVSGLFAAIFVSGCVGGPVSDGPQQFLAERGVSDDPQPGSFDYCWDHSCHRVVGLGFSDKTWAKVIAPIEEPAASAVEERRRLRAVIGNFEESAAAIAGTSGDKGGTMTAYGEGGQLDCVDETADTTVLLLMLDREGLLRWHRPATPAGRGNLVDGLMPHRTAAIVEKASGAEFAVDSWFHDNGDEPEVVSMALWLSGWTPEDLAVASGETAGGAKSLADRPPQSSREAPDCCAQAAEPGKRQREGSSDQAPQT